MNSRLDKFPNIKASNNKGYTLMIRQKDILLRLLEHGGSGANEWVFHAFLAPASQRVCDGCG